MIKTLNIIPLSAIREAYAKHEASLTSDEAFSYEGAVEYFNDSIDGGSFTYGDTDMTLVAVTRFVNEWPEYDAAVHAVLSSELHFGRDEPAYIDLEA